jgi:hypothetical protein
MQVTLQLQQVKAMKDSKTLLDQVAQKIAPSQSNSTTPAGHLDGEGSRTTIVNSDFFQDKEVNKSAREKTQLVEAINECFELLRINYQHLYFSAYSEIDAVNAAKRLWLESVAPFSADVVRTATHELIKHSDYLPTISRVIRKCNDLSDGNTLVDAHSAYKEACNAPSPKQNNSWSHPAIYYAGKKSDWYFLANNTEQRAFPIFKAHYEKICERVRNGEELMPVKQLALPETIETPLTKEDNVSRMADLRAELDI